MPSNTTPLTDGFFFPYRPLNPNERIDIMVRIKILVSLLNFGGVKVKGKRKKCGEPSNATVKITLRSLVTSVFSTFSRQFNYQIL